MARRAVADEREILKNFTEIMRGSADEVKPADKMKAAEFLAKHYAALTESGAGESAKIMIVDDIDGIGNVGED